MNPIDHWKFNRSLFEPNTIGPYDGWYTTESEYVEYVRVTRLSIIPCRVAQPRKNQRNNNGGESKRDDNRRREEHRGGESKRDDNKRREDRKRNNDEGGRVNSQPSNSRQPVEMKERMCKNILSFGKCRFHPCKFAHHADELTPLVCKYRNCRFQQTCSYIHQKESKEQYIERLRNASSST